MLNTEFDDFCGDGEYVIWIAETGGGETSYRLEVHDIDPSAPAGSNAASGWVVRVKNGQRYLDYTINDYQKAKYTKRNGPFYNNVIVNDTHIPIKNPYGEK